MTYSQDIVLSQTQHLIDCINTILLKNNTPHYVEIQSEVSHIPSIVAIELVLHYVLYTETSPKPTKIFTTKVTVDPELYLLHQEDIIDDLNDKFFMGILLHTNFTNKLNLFDLYDSTRKN